MDLKSSFRRTEEVAQYAHSEVSNGIARRAQDGSELMRIENGGNPNASFAERAFRQPYSSLNINSSHPMAVPKFHLNPEQSISE